MNYSKWVESKVLFGREATISLAVLEKLYPEDFPAIDAINIWAVQLSRELECRFVIYLKSDVITFYPRSKL